MANTRREFLLGGVAMAVGMTSAGVAANAEDRITDIAQEAKMPPTPLTTRKGDMPYRELGRTGEQVSLIGMGGAHIGYLDDAQAAVRLIRSAVDRGINFLDNCWDYNGGKSEERMGQALQDGYRDRVFLMTKIDGRTKQAAIDQLDESLSRLKTDRIDLLQFHEILRMEDPDRIFAEGGALEAVFDARKSGKVRYIGFTGHKDPLVHRRMLEVADQHSFHFDAAQMPVNVMDAHFRSFTHQVLPILAEKGIGALAMKTFGDNHILDHILASTTIKPVEMLHYSMTLPVSVVITGIDKPEILDQAIEAARTYEPLAKAQIASLLERTRTAASQGKYELFKTTTQFDGTAHNPQWLG